MLAPRLKYVARITDVLVASTWFPLIDFCDMTIKPSIGVKTLPTPISIAKESFDLI